MNRIRELRLKQSMKQPELGELLSCTAMTISRYERGEADPDVGTILRLCEIFGCSADYLLGRSPLPSPDLDPEEEQLLLEWRRADAHTRAVITMLLEPFKEETAPGFSSEEVLT